MEVFNTKFVAGFVQWVILLIPLVLLSVAVFKNVIVLGVISIVLLFAIVFFSPLTAGNENFWMFGLSSITLLPLNIKAAIGLRAALYDFLDLYFESLLITIILFFVLSNIEQIVLGVITRVIKPNQKRINVYYCY